MASCLSNNGTGRASPGGRRLEVPARQPAPREATSRLDASRDASSACSRTQDVISSRPMQTTNPNVRCVDAMASSESESARGLALMKHYLRRVRCRRCRRKSAAFAGTWRLKSEDCAPPGPGCSTPSAASAVLARGSRCQCSTLDMPVRYKRKMKTTIRVEAGDQFRRRVRQNHRAPRSPRGRC